MFSFDVPEKLSRLVGRFARADLLDKLTGLALSPDYAANAARIEVLIHLALAGTKGKKNATRSDLVALLNGFEDHPAATSEDPAEDVFVASVSTQAGNFRLFLGNHTGADYSLQRLLDAAFTEPHPRTKAIRRHCEALLRVSELLASRCGFAVNTVGESTPRRDDWPFGLPETMARGEASRFTHAELEDAGIDLSDLEAFILPSAEGLLDADFNSSALHRFPLVREGDSLRLPIPSFFSTALRLYIAQAINLGIVPVKAIERFHQSGFVRWLGLDLPLRKAKPLEIAPLNLPQPDIALDGIAQALLRFDDDKILHLLVLESDWRDAPEADIHEMKPAPPKFQKALTDYLKVVREIAGKQLGVTRGLSLIVQDSPGWGVVPYIPDKLGDDWYVTALPARSFCILLDDPAFSIIDLWKMLGEVDGLEAMGVKLGAWPELLNYWSIWQAFGSTFWPPMIDLRAFGTILPDTSKIIEKLAEIRQRTNRHAAPLVSGEWLRVERWVEELSPSQDSTKPIYMDAIAIPLGELRGVVEVEACHWWVVTARPPFDAEDRQLMRLVWEAAAEWLLRIGRTAAGRVPLAASPLEIRLLLTPEEILDAPDEINFMPAKGMAVVTIVFPPSLPEWLTTVDSSGEAILVRALLDAVLMLTETNMPEEERASWVAELTADPALKMIHVTPPSGDYGYAADLVAERVGVRFLQDADMAAATRLVRDELPADSNGSVVPAVGNIDGKSELSRVLNAAVDLHWHRCRAIIRQLDRKQTLVLVSRMIEALLRERQSDERSGMARSSFFAESPEYGVMSRLNMGRRDQSYQTYRFVAEMVLCEAPVVGGRVPGITDIDRIAAEVAALIQVAHNSDALHRDLIVVGATFHGDGSLEMAGGGAGALIRDYLMANFAESQVLDADNYPGLYEKQELNTAEDLLKSDDPFVMAFQAEFGIDLRQAFEVSGALQAVAVECKNDHVCLPLDEVRMLLRNREHAIAEVTLDAFIAAFGLQARTAWDGVPPKPYTQDDVNPWIFERRLSLMLKPVMVFQDGQDITILIYGVRHLAMGIEYVSHLLETGDWPPKRLVSAQAKAWLDLEGNRRGLAFEVEVQGIFQRAGWQAEQGIALQRFGAPGKLGDLDILAIAPDGKTWWAVECKWFGAARTPREIANWLEGFRGAPDDKLNRHLKRFDWIRNNAAAVAKHFKIKHLPDTIIPKIVTTTPVPIFILQYLPDGSDVLTRRELIAALGANPPRPDYSA